MKSLNKMIASAAAMATMCFGAKAGEMKFYPTDRDGARMDSIEVIHVKDNEGENTHLGVRSTNAMIGPSGKGYCMGLSSDRYTPFMLIGTNTTKFASSGFGHGFEENNVQIFNVGNGKFYLKEEGNTNDVYTTQVSSRLSMHGIGSIKKVENVDQDPIARAILDGDYDENGNFRDSEGNLVKFFEGKAYTLKHDGVYNGTTNTISFVGGPIPESTKEKDFVLVKNTKEDRLDAYILGDDNTVYSDVKAVNGLPADSIAATDNNTKLVIKSGSDIKVFDPTKITTDPNRIKVVNTDGIPSDAKCVVVSGDAAYWINKTGKYLHCKELH